METPSIKPMDADLTKLPLEFIDGTINILSLAVARKALPSSARLYLGIYSIPDQKGEEIALPWSPLCLGHELKFPLQNLEIHSTHDDGIKHILGIACGALAFLQKHLMQPWRNQSINDVFQGRDNGGHGKLASDQFAAHIRVGLPPILQHRILLTLYYNFKALLDFNLVVSKLGMILSLMNQADSPERIMILCMKFRHFLYLI